MAYLATKIKLYANREVDFRKDVKINVDQNGINGSITEWNLDIPKPTMAQLDAFEAQANEVERLNIIKSNRAKAYPSIQEQLDMQYWDKINGTDTWEQAINAVKTQYPKS